MAWGRGLTPGLLPALAGPLRRPQPTRPDRFDHVRLFLDPHLPAVFAAVLRFLPQPICNGKRQASEQQAREHRAHTCMCPCCLHIQTCMRICVYVLHRLTRALRIFSFAKVRAARRSCFRGALLPGHDSTSTLKSHAPSRTSARRACNPSCIRTMSSPAANSALAPKACTCVLSEAGHTSSTSTYPTMQCAHARTNRHNM